MSDFFNNFVPMGVSSIQSEAAEERYLVYLYRYKPHPPYGKTNTWLAYRDPLDRQHTLSVYVRAKNGQQAKQRAVSWMNKMIKDPEKYCHEFCNLGGVNFQAPDHTHISNYPELQFVLDYFD